MQHKHQDFISERDSTLNSPTSDKSDFAEFKGPLF